jgi:hypothetical protein
LVAALIAREAGQNALLGGSSARRLPLISPIRGTNGCPSAVLQVSTRLVQRESTNTMNADGVHEHHDSTDADVVFHVGRDGNLDVAREPIQGRIVDQWIRSHPPARCQSRKRRQHVIPDPHLSSCGSLCQGIPLRRTKSCL